MQHFRCSPVYHVLCAEFTGVQNDAILIHGNVHVPLRSASRRVGRGLLRGPSKERSANCVRLCQTHVCHVWSASHGGSLKSSRSAIPADWRTCDNACLLPHLPTATALVWRCVAVMPIVPIRQSVSVAQTSFRLHLGGACRAQPIAQHYAYAKRA